MNARFLVQRDTGDLTLRDRVPLRSAFVRSPSELLFEFLQLLVGEIFKIDKLISCALECADHLIQFQMNRFGVAVLGVLNQKYHQKRDNGRGGVDDQLPRIGKMKGRTCYQPDNDDEHSSSKCPSAAENDGGTTRKNTERVTDDTKEIAALFVSCWFF